MEYIQHKEKKINIMQTPAAIIWLFKYFGLPGIVIGLFADFANWLLFANIDWTKIQVSFWVGIPFAVVRFGFYISEQLDKKDKRKRDAESERIRIETEKLDLQYKKEKHDNR